MGFLNLFGGLSTYLYYIPLQWVGTIFPHKR